MDAKRVAVRLLPEPSRTFGVTLWDGTRLDPPTDRAPASRLVLRAAKAVKALVPPITERRLAEAFIAADIEIEGDIVAFLEAAATWRGPSPFAIFERANLVAFGGSDGKRPPARLRAALHGLWHSAERDEPAARHHYD